MPDISTEFPQLRQGLSRTSLVRWYPELYICVKQKYEQSRDDIYAAMSADATCRGLRSARDGQFLMEFSPGKRRHWPHLLFAGEILRQALVIRSI